MVALSDAQVGQKAEVGQEAEVGQGLPNLTLFGPA